MVRIYTFEYFPKKPGLFPKLITYYHLFRIRLLKKRKPLTNEEAAERAYTNKELIIQIMYGGLGDHLIYSSLPKLLWEQKGIKTYISDKSLYTNAGIRDFVWKNNPFISFTPKKGWFNMSTPEGHATYDSYLQKLFKLSGSGHPELFYTPKKIFWLQDTNLVDVSYGLAGKTNGYTEHSYREKICTYVRDNIPTFVLVLYKNRDLNELQKILIEKFAPKTIEVSSIEEVCDALASAKRRYLLYSGTASLSAGLELESTILCARKANLFFQYPVNTYISL